MSSDVHGEVQGVLVYSNAAAYSTVRDGIRPGWYRFCAEGTQVYFRPYKADSSWEYTRDGCHVERGAARSFYLASGQFDYYIPAGGTLRVERIRPLDPYVVTGA